MKKTILVSSVITLLVSCTGNNQQSETTAAEDSTTHVASVSPKVGSDKDEHGCIGSAGYQWSVLKNKCIRTFEEADAKLMPIEDTTTYRSNAVLIFNADQSKVELYMPDQKGSLILNRTGEEGNYSWKNDSLDLFAWKGYALRKNGKAIFHGD
ncbi:hypothetical protein [Spirosoma validum]|uniref:Uncharacterized protein n=1 Tax=Spirosoma validum TaxID=2771355 RepID=A0A927AYU1_9BACT|nr:hypothetical protein [Spirosoma validum]MBD2752265.1 hypothetical protein [Spirosoma validum]